MTIPPRDDIYRSYREKVSDLICYRLGIGETDLWVSSSWDSKEAVRQEVRRLRIQLKEYISLHPDFATTLEPWFPSENINNVPEIIRVMTSAGALAKVGPMAAVAGAIAGLVGKKLYQEKETLIIENGGDIFLSTTAERKIGIFAGGSVFSSRLALRITTEMSPLGICTSAGKVGHSLSLGQADAAVVLAHDTALADAAATALGNRVKKKKDCNSALQWLQTIPGILGGLVVVEGQMAAWGQVELVPIATPKASGPDN